MSGQRAEARAGLSVHEAAQTPRNLVLSGPAVRIWITSPFGDVV